MPEWTAEQIDFLRQKVAEGYTAGDISIKYCRTGQLLGYRTRNAVMGQISRLNLKLARSGTYWGYWTDSKLNELSGLYHSPLGHTRPQIAGFMNIKEKQLLLGITKLRRRDGIVGRKPQGPQAFRKSSRKASDPFQRVSLTDLRPSQSTAPVTFLELANKHCRWPQWSGAPAIETMLFCGADRNGKEPYCAEHCRRAYRA